MKILFVDDSPERYIALEKRIQANVAMELIWCKTSFEAQDAIKKDHFDVICLDHDLGDGHTDETEDGTALMKWIIENPLNEIETSVFIIHSHNSPAAGRMRDILDNGNFLSAPFVIPFHARFMASLLLEIKCQKENP